jgi:hypothetical protein
MCRPLRPVRTGLVADIERILERRAPAFLGFQAVRIS